MHTDFLVRFSRLQYLLGQSLSPATLTSIGIHALLLLALPSWLANSSFSNAIVQRPVGVIELTPEEAAQLPNANPAPMDLSQLFGQTPIAPPAAPPDARSLFSGLPSLPGLPQLAPLPVPFPADAFTGLPAPPPIIPLDWYAPPAPARIAVGPPQARSGTVERTVIISGDGLDDSLGEGLGDGSEATPMAGATTPAPDVATPGVGTPPTVSEAGVADAPSKGRASDLGGPLTVARADLEAAAPDYGVDTVTPAPDTPAASPDYPVETQEVAVSPAPVMAPPVTVIVPYPASACPIAPGSGYTTVETDAQGQIIAGPVIDLGHPDLNAAARSAVLAQSRSLGAAVYQYNLSVEGQGNVCGQ